MPGTVSQSSLGAGLAMGLIVFAHACTFQNITEVPVGSVEVQPSSLTLLEGETQRLAALAKDESGRNLPNGAVTWFSDAPSVFSIDESGMGTALAPGQATIWANLSGTRGSAQVSVEVGPTIVVGGPSLLFTGAVGGAAPDPITLEIINGGGGSVAGLSASVHYAEGGAAGWLSLALAGTTAPTSLVLTGLLGILEEGTHEATLILASQDPRISPVTVPVRASVILDKPIIGLSSRAVEFRGEATGPRPAPETIQVTNQGGDVLSGLQATSLYAGDGGWLSASLTGTTAPTELLVQPDPSGLNPGSYMAEVRVAGVGALNTPLSIDVTFTIDVGPASPANSTATVPDGTAGLPTNIVVQARDAHGNPQSAGGETVAVTVSGANAGGGITATDVGDGTYTAEYTPTTPGTDEVAITMNGAPIGGDPFTSRVVAGSVSPANSTASVPNGRAKRSTNIVVQARDAYGNPLGVGGETVEVTVSGTNQDGPITATDVGDGTYTAEYTPTTPGTDEVAITMNGAPIGGSPFTSTVDAGSASPANSTATVPDGTAGLPTNIVIQARDGSGEPFNFGGARVVVTVSGANNAGSLMITDRSNGTYIARYTPTSAGTDRVTIKMEGTPIGGSPFTSTVDAGSASPANSTATVPDGTAGLSTSIVVLTVDAYGNPVSTGGATVVFTVSGADAAGPITATDVGDGTYTASYTPTSSGTDEVAITMNGATIGGNPFTSEVAVGIPSPANSTATVPDGTAGLPTNIVVQARDAPGNPQSVGGESVVVTVSGANAAGPITTTDVGDGTYTASYIPTSSGTDEVAITMNGATIGSDPFTSTVVAGSVSPANSTATVPNGKRRKSTSIVVQARDTYGNPLGVGGETVEVTVSGTNQYGPVIAVDMGDGTYTLSYKPQETGTDFVAITLNGTPINGSPFTSKVRR